MSGTFTVECATDFRKCNNGSCLHEKLWCDGNNDCGDLSDEQNCTLKGIAKETKENTLKCHDPKKFQCKSDHLICLDDSQLCNGKAECPNGEDEANCHECTSDQFICERNECIAMKMRCDNHKVRHRARTLRSNVRCLTFLYIFYRIVKMEKMKWTVMKML